MCFLGSSSKELMYGLFERFELYELFITIDMYCFCLYSNNRTYALLNVLNLSSKFHLFPIYLYSLRSSVKSPLFF